MEPRSSGVVNFDTSAIKSGDYFGIIRMDGLSPIIMYGTGAHISHNAMAMWLTEEDGTEELYVFESQGGWYWPVNGLQKTKFSEWMKLAENASHLIVWLPLRDDLRASFNATASYEWFKTVEGLPYGMHNFLFGWIDTVQDNYPSLMTSELLVCAFGVLEKVIPKSIQSIFGEAMNIRLGTKDLNMAEITAEAAARNQTVGQLMTIVEEEGWEYSDGPNYVCSSFVIAMWKRGGLFGDMVLQATEFSPGDVVPLDVFNKTSVRPQECVEADPGLPYCQLMGAYRIDLGDTWSHIKPYSHMAERCPSKAPYYPRPNGC
jgi:hypothetical protein